MNSQSENQDQSINSNIQQDINSNNYNNQILNSKLDSKPSLLFPSSSSLPPTPLHNNNTNNNNINSSNNNSNRSRVATLIPNQPPTQQKRHNSQSYPLQGVSTKRGAIFTPNSSSSIVNNNNNDINNSNIPQSNTANNININNNTTPGISLQNTTFPSFTSVSANPSQSFTKHIPISTSIFPTNQQQQPNSTSHLLSQILHHSPSAQQHLQVPQQQQSSTTRKQQNLINNPLQLSPKHSVAIQVQRNKLAKTPTPTISNFEVPASPKSKAIAKVFESGDMSVTGSSELNEVPTTRGNNQQSDSPESISEQRNHQSTQQATSNPQAIPENKPQPQGIAAPRRPSTETVLSQPPPPAPLTQQQRQQPQQQQRMITEEEQILASNLQETYKAILKLEVETQQGCAEVNERLIENDAGAEITPQLWLVYKNVIRLLDQYYDFLLYALSPNSARAGKPLVTNYRILRRMWVYGVVSFLEVLKNVAAIFVEHEVCGCFISYAFNIIGCLTDGQLGVEGWWAEKLGDLSRMAIALYPANYMDWKISSVYWYQLAMKTQFGHGKIYYHMCTVEIDNLEALVDIGKSVTCRDPFVPTPQYLRMIVDNVCSQRNILSSVEMAMIDFVKIHKILLMPNYNTNQEMANLVSHYSAHLGMDTSNVDFFQLRGEVGGPLSVDKVNFWFQKGSNFALCNISHLIGFGDSRNPFAKLFDLPEALKQRKDKKDKRRKSKSDITKANSADDASNKLNDSEAMFNSTASEQDENSWFMLLDFINKGVIELSMRMLKQYITGPLQTSTPHVIVWLYFIISIGEAANRYPSSKPLFYYFVTKFIPWDKLTPYLNDILCIVRSQPEMRKILKEHCLIKQNSKDYKQILNYLSENEKLWEVWKCWGSLWFDNVSLKSDYATVFETGVKGDIFDLPTSGLRYDPKNDSHRFIRIILLATFIADNYPDFGLVRSSNIFKFKLNSEILNYETNNTSVAYFSQDTRFQNMFEKSNPKICVDSESVNENDIVDEFKWCDKNENPELPTWDYNSYGFMNEFINNNYPVSTNDTVSSTYVPILPKFGEIGNINSNHDEDDEYEEGSSDFEDDDDSNSNNNHVTAYTPNTVKIPGDIGEKMDTSLTYISLDTNAWLKHCGRIYKCIRSDIFLLSIPLTVFQELRSLRRSPDSAVADSATRAVIIIRQLYNDKEISPIRADGSRASSLNETLEFEKNQDWRSNTDEIIMNAIKSNDELGKSLLLGNNFVINKNSKLLNSLEASVFKYNILVTDDRNMGLRSKSIGLTTFNSAWLFTQIDKISEGRSAD